MNNSKIEWQFCTKQQALRLVELGVKPEALFWHIKAKSEKHGESIVYGWTSEAIAPAYSVGELGAMLPRGFDTMPITSDCGSCTVWKGFGDGGLEYPHPDKEYPTEAQARADMIIHLLEDQYKLPADWCQNPNDAAEVHKVKIAKEALCSQGSTEAIAG